MENLKFEIAPWAGGKKAAVALTFDDWTPGHPRVALPLLDRFGMKGTFFVVLNDLWSTPERDDWIVLNAAVRRGHEIGNHSRTHRDLTQLSAIELVDEIEGARSEFDEALHGPRVSTFAHPFGVCSERVLEWVGRHHVAARSFENTPEQLRVDDDFATTDAEYGQVIPLRLWNGVESAEFGSWLDRALAEGGFLSTVSHGVFSAEFPEDAGRYDAIDLAKLESFLLEIEQRMASLWVTTFARAMIYHRARRASQLDVRLEASGTYSLRAASSAAFDDEVLLSVNVEGSDLDRVLLEASSGARTLHRVSATRAYFDVALGETISVREVA